MSLMRTLLTCAALTSFAGVAQSQKPEIIQKPITFNEERKQLTLEYMSEHYGMEQDEPTIEPTMVVVHWTVVPTLEKTFSVFDPVRLPNYRKEIQSGGSVNV